MSARRRIAWPAAVVTAVATAAVSPLVAAPLVGPAWAERMPGGPQRTVTSAGSIDSVTVTGPARLDTASTVTAKAVVRVPARTQADLTMTLAGRTCRSTQALPSGRSTVQVTCEVTPRAEHVPSLPATVEVVLDRVTGATMRRATRRVQRSVAIDDGAPVPLDQAAGRWQALSAALHEEASELPKSVYQAASRYSSANLASEVWREAQASGWHSSATQALLARLMATRKPDGGYGLGAPWDAYDDGSLNPVQTTYTVTTSGHVGWLLLEGYKAGALPTGGLSSAVDAMLVMPRLNGGTCFAYSNSTHDAGLPCVYNVSHGAAAFLVQVRELTSYRAEDIDRILLALRSRLADGYNPATGYWAYMAGSTKAQDVSHQVYTAKSVDIVDPSFHAVDRMMALPWWRQPGGMTQSASALASAMIDIAKDCRYTRSPAVLLAAERALDTGAPSFTVLGMAAVADEIVGTCFA